MSYVTNVILTCSFFDEENIKILNEKVAKLPGVSFAPTLKSTGTKGLECVVCVGAFNYLPIDDLVSAIQSVPWKGPQWVQLFIQDQNEDRFTERPLFGGANG